MAFGVEVLRFQLPGHEAATLRNMNQLRSEERFCDVTVVAESLKFRGHKVVLAACSPFLRDKFLLNPSSEVQVSLMHSSKIVADLLLSCYTGMLEFAVRDVVNYLTAASYLQMEHVVEKCRNALFQFIEPKISLKEEGASPGKSSFMVKRTKAGLSKEAKTFPRGSQILVKSELSQEECEEELEGKPEDEEIFNELENDEEDDEDDEDALSDICIVEVESATEMPKKEELHRAHASAESSEPDESQINSTMEGMSTEMERVEKASTQGVVKAHYSLLAEGGGEGLVVIPRGGREEGEVSAGSGECQSSSSSSANGGGAAAPAASSGRGYTCRKGKDLSKMFEGVKNIKCTKCEDFFTGIEKLVYHMRAAHLIFMCPRCGKQFNHSSNLNRHMNVHRGIKSHSCTICGKSFTQKSTLYDHMNLHSGERPYRCSYCDVRFAHKPAIRRHLKEQHGKTTAENFMDANLAEISVVVC
ncbi:zinc finger and BTB domain-containing protein 12 [Latimeria chalumnae]|uniref:Zinc finger and BTB domain containing 12 n=1 Tax=Latimeria chalumnae TaxID=7897 RepID=H3AAU8_LATCH|nr:PREDICTED: zinc finger and BTB domain-containing protein 12 [Latimeria chalumnae]XP_006007246.1 PREDICTED: zinc finger and BTB domain-containing protein 12 [Latimeria chalumnae]XP_014350752.1 PREDICTED: zinc finger and BTB domain-containing protein 12 [Latimeria chalumnae]|eukprot:XP_006007245.1 PREDICTED: zinc finger and BTB domain-containing protein 12 [Latimeria chalumnae]